MEVPEGALPITAGSDGYVLESSVDLTADPVVWTVEPSSNITAPDASADPPTTQFSFVHDLSSVTPNAGITRYYRVRAVNAAGAGEWSTGQFGTTPDVPDAPTGLTVGEVTVNSSTDTQNDIALSWNSVPDANNGGLTITGYNVMYLTDAAGATWQDATGGTPVPHAEGVIETTHAGLDEATGSPPEYLTYYYRVRAVNAASPAVTAADDDEWSSRFNRCFIGPTRCPRQLDCHGRGPARMPLTCSGPHQKMTGEPPVTSYRIERTTDLFWHARSTHPNLGLVTFLEENYPGTGRAYRDRNLTTTPTDGRAYPDGPFTYSYRVSAVNVVGAGDPSNVDGARSSEQGTHA